MQNQKETPIENLASGEHVIDRNNSHLDGDPRTLMAVKAALRKIHSQGREFIEEEATFPQIMGTTICVETRPTDIVVYAPREGRQGFSRLVLNRQPEPTNKVSVVLKRTPDGQYVLITGFIGKKARPETWDERAFQRSRDPRNAKASAVEFWSRHALIFDAVEIQTNAFAAKGELK